MLEKIIHSQKGRASSCASSNKHVVMKIICVFFIISTSVLSLSFYLHKKGEAELSDRNFPYLNPARKAYDQRYLIVDVQFLRDWLKEYSEQNQNVSVYFEYLNTGANISVNNSEFWPASLLKLPVAMAVAKKIERGEWNWTDKLLITEQDKNNRYGDLYKVPNNTPVMIDDLVHKMLTDSDNTAYFSLLRNMDAEEMSAIYKHLGLNNFLGEEGKISAKRYSVLLRSLYNSTYLSDNNSQRILSYLEETSFNNFLSSGIDEGVKFAHKFGISDERDVYLDSGIVFLQGRPYILTVIIQNEEQEIAEEMMREISTKVFQYVRDKENIDL
jgi:beta-lactamase class A